MSLFDVSIDIYPSGLPFGMSPDDAVARVKAAVAAMPGAGWISVEWHIGPQPFGPHVCIHEGTEIALNNAARHRLSRLVKEVVTQILSPGPTLYAR